MKHLVSFLEAKSKHDTDYHIDRISDILVEFTDESLVKVNSIMRDGSSSKTFIIKISVPNDTAVKKGLATYVRSWNDEQELRYFYPKLDSYMNDCANKILKRLKHFKYFKYQVYNGQMGRSGLIIKVAYRPGGLKKG